MVKRPKIAALIPALLTVLLGWFLFRSFPRDAASNTRHQLVFLHGGTPQDEQFWRWVIVEFEKNHPDVQIRQEYLAAAPLTARSQPSDPLLDRIRNGEPPDIALASHLLFQQHQGRFHDLGEFLAGAADTSSNRFHAIGLLEKSGIQAFQSESSQYGLPFSGGNLLIFLNRRSFHQASEFHGKSLPLPGGEWTVPQFLKTAEWLTCDFDRDGQPDQFGFWLPQWAYYLPFIWSFGADLTDPDGKHWTFSGPTAQSVMRFYRQLATGDAVAPCCERAARLQLEADFASGKIAMCVNGPWFIPVLERSGLAGDYIIAPIPSGPGGRSTKIIWDGLVMRRNLPAQRRDHGWAFIEWALTREVQTALARRGNALPARLEAHGAFVASDPPRRQPFIDALAYSRLQPRLPGYEALDQAIARHFEQATDPKRAFEAMTMLDALARDPAILSAFAAAGQNPP